MKDRTLIYISLVLSTGAIGYAAWVHHCADHLAVEALHKREIEFVAQYASKMRQVYSDMGGSTNVFAKPPQTIEELLQPMVAIMNRLTDAEEKTDSTDGKTK